MSLPSDLLPVENIVLDLNVGSKKRLFEEVAQVFAAHSQIEIDKVFQCLLAREKLGSTGLGCGVAIPHGRMVDLNSAQAVFVRLKKPVEFESQDEKPVSLVFAMLVPEQNNTEHLKILSHLAQKFSEKAVRDQLQAAQFPEDIIKIIILSD